MNNIERIDGIEIDWNKFKSKAKGKTLEKARQGYIDLCKLLHNNGHKLEGEYIRSGTKVLIDFNCGHDPHLISPDKYKMGRRCPKCSGHCPEQAKEDLINLINRNGHKLLSEYVKSDNKVLIDFCCGHDPHWIIPPDYKNGHGCPKCSGNCSEQAKEELINLINKRGHKLLSEYIDTKTKVIIDFCCGHEPSPIFPSVYKKGANCPRCNGKGGQAEEDLINLINRNGHKLLSEYKGTHDKVLIDFNCGHTPHWAEPNAYKRGTGCPKCSGTCPEQAKEEFMNMLKENNHKLLSEYKDATTKVLIDFRCNHKPNWIKPNSYKNGTRCPLCKNKGEGALYQLLIDMGYTVETQKKYNDLKDNKSLSYDFYIPEYNLLIELDGEHHRKEVVYTTKNMSDKEKDMADIDAFLNFQDRKHKDKLKDDYARSNNIPLLRIEYNKKIEFDKWKKFILDKISDIENLS